MKTMKTELSLQILADDQLVAVAGAHLRRRFYPYGSSVKQSNSVGDIEVDASGGGSVSITISQSNSNS